MDGFPYNKNRYIRYPCVTFAEINELHLSRMSLIFTLWVRKNIPFSSLIATKGMFVVPSSMGV